MRVLLLFFLLLSSSLFGGKAFANIIGQGNMAGSLAVPPSTADVQPEHRDHQCLQAKTHGIRDDESDLITTEDDNEEDITRKHVQLVKYLFAFTWSFLAADRFDSGAPRLYSGGQLPFILSHKYIVQRVLRI